MAKKHKNIKLAQGSFINKQKKISPFGKFANRLADAKKKKAQKISDTQKRLIQSKRNNKMIKISKKTKKFGLLDDNQDIHEGGLGGLTHKGMPLKQIDEFNDMQFDSEMLQNNDQFQAAHDNLNFAGFDQQQNKEKNQDRPKSKNEVYKEIIQKSKAYKMFRQQVYEENLNVATQLDEQFHDFVGNLKFRSQDRKVKDKIEGRDLDYDRLMNQLKEDQRVVSNKVIQKNEKYTQKIRKKKSDQLNKLMKDGSDDENDIRGWIQDVNNSNQEVSQQQLDELDDVQLSSGDQEQDQQDQKDQNQFQNSQQLEYQQNQSQKYSNISDNQNQDFQCSSNQNQNQDEQEEEEQEEEYQLQKKRKKNSSINKIVKNKKNLQASKQLKIKQKEKKEMKSQQFSNPSFKSEKRNIRFSQSKNKNRKLNKVE